MKTQTGHVYVSLFIALVVSIYMGGYSVANAQLTGCKDNYALCNPITQQCLNDSCIDIAQPLTTGTNGNQSSNTLTTGTNGNPSSQPLTTGTNGNGSGGGLMNPLQAQNIQQLFDEILNFLITIGGIVIVLMLVFVGFKFVLAQGESEALSSARKALFWTVIGALVLLGAKAIEAGVMATIQSL